MNKNIKCEICKKELKAKNYCTVNVCRECCITMKCPIRHRCLAYIQIMEKIVKAALETVYELGIEHEGLEEDEFGPGKIFKDKQDWIERTLLGWSEEQ